MKTLNGILGWCGPSQGGPVVCTPAFLSLTSVTDKCTTASPRRAGVSPGEDLCPRVQSGSKPRPQISHTCSGETLPWGDGTELFLELSLQASSSELYEEDWFVSLGVWSLWCEITMSSQKPGGVAWPSPCLTGWAPGSVPSLPPRGRLSTRRAATASWPREPLQLSSKLWKIYKLFSKSFTVFWYLFLILIFIAILGAKHVK